MRVLALDPGKVNFAGAVLDDKKVVKTFYLDTIKSLTWDSFNAEAKAFRESYLSILKEISPDCVVAERFMYRPGKPHAGAIGEYVNVMLGIISTINALMGIPIHLVTSAQWKVYIQKRYGMSKTKGMKDWFPHLSIHEADALGIAVYAMENELEEKLLKRIALQKNYEYVGKSNA